MIAVWEPLSLAPEFVACAAAEGLSRLDYDEGGQGVGGRSLGGEGGMPVKGGTGRHKGARGALTQLRLDELQIFRKVMELGKGSLAARSLGLSPSAVSRALSRLESTTGKAFFRHEGNRMIATAEALAFDRSIDPILVRLREVESGDQPGAVASRLRISVLPSVAMCALGPLIAGFRKAHPEIVVSLELSAGSATAVISSVASGNADLGISNTQGLLDSVSFEVFRRSRTFAILPAGHRLARRSRIAVRDLEGEAVILPATHLGRRSALDAMLEQAGTRPRIVAEVSSSVVAMQLAQAGMGIALFDAFPVALLRPKGVVFRPLDPEQPILTRFVWPARGVPSAAARLFADFFKAHQPEDGYSEAVR